MVSFVFGVFNRFVCALLMWCLQCCHLSEVQIDVTRCSTRDIGLHGHLLSK